MKLSFLFLDQLNEFVFRFAICLQLLEPSLAVSQLFMDACFVLDQIFLFFDQRVHFVFPKVDIILKSLSLNTMHLNQILNLAL